MNANPIHTSGDVGDRLWGPLSLANGKTRFQLWAPAQKSIGLQLAGKVAPMDKAEGGWHRVEVDTLPGAAYAFVLEDGRVVGDPASRQQVSDLDGPSLLSDGDLYRWRTADWAGRPWEETVVYEIHIGAFTQEGTFRAAMPHLASLADLGITAVEIMPVAHFPGKRGWGYDGVLQYAPHIAYGAPDDFRAFIDEAHSQGLMVFLDVVYNHFGPEGNYLGRYAPGFFKNDATTPWGAAIAYENPAVRAYFLENVHYWLRDFRLDGLRFDAIDQIDDGSEVHILKQIAETVRREYQGRHVHLITENPANGTDLMAEIPAGRLYEADWNDDFHHALHVAVTGEAMGYYEPFKEDTWGKLRRIMAQGYLEPGKAMVSDTPPPSESLPPTAFIHFLQNHDQVGNRALGDRLHLAINRELYRAVCEVLLLSPQIPLLFMGDEYLASSPFHFFADYEGDIAEAVRENRPNEAANFGGIPWPKTAADIPDPTASATFLCSKLDWNEAASGGGVAWTEFLRSLINLRHREIVPLLRNASGYSGTVVPSPEKCLFIDWQFGKKTLQLRANLSASSLSAPTGLGERIYTAYDNIDGHIEAFATQVFIRS